MYLKELSSLNGVSGNEDSVRDFIIKKIENKVDKVEVDSIGNVICLKKGISSNYKVMVVAHMDEVGFIITGINSNGTLKFKSVGGIDSIILPGKKVIIGKKNTAGVIGILPIHLQSSSARNTPKLKIEDMYIDIGANSRESVKDVKKGDFVSFESKFRKYGNNTFKGKAFDDRVGCSLIMDLIDKDKKYNFDLYFCFSVQEELGLRGAKVLGYTVNPDIAIIVEGTTCADVPDVKDYAISTKLNGGAVLTIVDGTSYSDKKLMKYILGVSEKEKIKTQFKNTKTGGNDAGMIQTSKNGVKTAIISAPVRYLHSPSSVISLNDYKSCFEILEELILGLSLNDCSEIKNIYDNNNKFHICN